MILHIQTHSKPNIRIFCIFIKIDAPDQILSHFHVFPELSLTRMQSKNNMGPLLLRWININLSVNK